ncbi:MAG TPA: hypothetical protein PKN32_11100 [Bacteroidales bacterium]|nr:hypothetical protein [Bacteroidales bacterium]
MKLVNRKSLSLAIIGLFLVNYICAQVNNNSIDQINKTVNEINENHNLSFVVLEEDGFLDSAFINQPGEAFGTLTGFFSDGEIVMIEEVYGIQTPTDIAVIMYYFAKGTLIYVIESENYSPNVFLNNDGTVDYKDISYDFEGQYYFIKDSFIEKTSGQQILIPNKETFLSQSKEGQLLLNAERYSAILKDAYKNQ